MPEPIAVENFAERLEGLDIKENPNLPEREYVHVDGAMQKPSYSPCSPTLSLSAAEKWEEELMEDPKVFQTQHQS